MEGAGEAPPDGAGEQADPEGVHAAVAEGGSRLYHQEVGYADAYVPNGASALYVRATLAGLLRAVRIDVAGQLAPRAPRTVRTPYAY